MRLGRDQVGPGGLALLGVVGVLGIVLAVHGYGRGTVVPGGATGPTATGGHRPRSTTPATKSTATTTAPGSSGQKLGPSLTSTPYAAYAYELYPGTESGQAKSATAGFDVRITPGNGTFTVSVAAGTTRTPQTTTYPVGDRVYFVEASFGDDSNNSDYSYGDDGIVVTDSHGRIVQ